MKFFVRKSPWYVAGLAFECAACGRCCAGPEEGYVWVTPEEIRAIAAHLGLSEGQARVRYVRQVGRRLSLIETPGSNDCIFLQGDGGGTGRRCGIYAVRPTQCRTWPFWASNLADPTAWAAAGARCRGVNRGQRFPVNEIERLRDLTRE